MKALVTLFWVLLAACSAARAVEVKVTAGALERTLKAQLFRTPAPEPGQPSRYYLRGKPSQACSVYAEDPHVEFADDRIVVKMKVHSRVGKAIKGFCLGIYLTNEVEASFIPEAEEESIGFRDARIDQLFGNKELDALLVPFLSKKLPEEMKVNAATLLKTLLVRAPDSTGYTVTLESLKLHSMMVESGALVVDLDAVVRVE